MIQKHVIKMSEVTKEILSRINERKTLDAISKEMDMRESTVRARIDSMIHEGYLAEIQYASGCSMCPMSCNSQSSCDSGIKMYSLTKKGKRLIET
jgi:predicted ArsR family transcriptional regulator